MRDIINKILDEYDSRRGYDKCKCKRDYWEGTMKAREAIIKKLLELLDDKQRDIEKSN